MGRVVKVIARILFSHVGFCVIICGYAVAGAFLMRYIELSGEKQRHNQSQILAQLVDDHREWTTEQIITYCHQNPQVNASEAVAYIGHLLNSYHESIAYARNHTATYGRQAYRGRNNYNEVYGWSIPSAVLFTTTILSTVGYGHVYPVTETGYLVCTLYSVFAIPLMSMFLVNISGLFLKAIRVVFNRGCCAFLHRKRRQQHAIDYLRENPHVAWENGKHQYLSSGSDCVSHYSGSGLMVYSMEQFQEDNLVPATVSLFLFLGYFALGMAAWYTATATSAKWSFVESAYFSMVTLLTIGFGDYVPGYTPRTSKPNEVVLACCAAYIVIGSVVLTTAVGLAFEGLRYRKKLHQRQQISTGSIYDDNHFQDSDVTPPHTH